METLPKKYTISKNNISNNINESNIINSFKKNDENELNDILNLIYDESNRNTDPPYSSIKKLTIYIRRNRNLIENVINKIYDLLKNISNVNLILNIVDSILDLVTERRSHYLNQIIDILIKKLDNIPQASSSSIIKIVTAVGDLIKLDSISIQKYLEGIIEKILITFSKPIDQKNTKLENAKFYCILLLSKIIENSSLFAYNILTKEDNFNNFQKIILYFKDPKPMVQNAVGELIKQFNHVLKTRDHESKSKYQTIIFNKVCSEYIEHLKDNNDEPNNIHLVSGIFIFLKNLYNSETLVLIKDPVIYTDLLQNLSKCLNSKYNNIKIQFIKCVPELYKMNKDIFTEKYLNKFLEESNKYLNIKVNSELRKAVLVTLGNLSLYIKKETFVICLDNLISLLKALINEKNNFDDEIFKCLADLLNNKQKLYMETILTKFEINTILIKIFKNGLTEYKIKFLTSILTSFNSFSVQYITIAIASLNAVSLILCDEDFQFEFFYKHIEALGAKNIFIDKNLDNILSNIKKYVRKYINNISSNSSDINQNNIKNSSLSKEINQIPEYIKCKCLSDIKTIKYALALFSGIEDSFFLKDMLIFYNDKILPLLPIANNKIKKKIIALLTSNFFKIFPDDVNYSEFLLNNTIDSLSNLIFNIKDASTQVYVFKTLQKKNLFLDIILKTKEAFCNKLMSFINTDIDKDVKKIFMQFIGNLMERSKEKKYFIALVKKSVNNFLFEIYFSEDVIYKEDFIELLYYISIYLKNMLDIILIEKILKSLIYLNLNYNYKGNIYILSLKIVYELISSELINYNFLININYRKEITKYCYILLIFVVNNLKEGGDNSIETKISLKILYQIIKILRINIYNEIEPNNVIEYIDSLDMKNNSSFNSEESIKINHNKEMENENFNNINNKKKSYFNYNKELLIKTRKNEKINLARILIQCIIKGQNDDENLNIIMNIFALSGSMDPLVMEKLFIDRELTMYRSEGISYEKDYFEEINYKFLKYNKKKQIMEEISLDNIEPIKYIPILYILKILKENTQQELIRQIINNFGIFISNLELKDENLVEIILPNIIKIIQNLTSSQKNEIFDSIICIIHNYRKITKENLKNLVNLTKNYIIIDLYFDKCYDIFKFLFDNFVNEMEAYYHELIPIFLSFINYNYDEKNTKEKKYENHIIDLILVMIKNENIYHYLNSIFDKLIPLFLKKDDFNEPLITLFKKIVKEIPMSYTFYPLLINALIEKLKIYAKDKSSLNKGKNSDSTSNKEFNQLLEKIMNIFNNMNLINKDKFVNFLPMIIKNIKNISLIKCADYEKEILPMLTEYPTHNYLNISNYRTKKILQLCFPKCKLGFIRFKHSGEENTNKKSNNDNKSLKLNTSAPNQYDKIPSLTLSKNYIKKKNLSRRNIIDDDLIIKAFDISNCFEQKDWLDWFKSMTKVLFDQSPSIFLKSSIFLTEYYFPLIIELYNYSFLDVYKTINEQKKTFLSSNLAIALKNPKTPDEILLAILNLEEFAERKNVDMYILDNYLFGKVSYKCKAYAKALYFYENNFINKNDFDDINNLLELYYELELPESAIGLLLKSSEKNKNKFKRRYSVINYEVKKMEESFASKRRSINFEKIEKDKEYNFYIKMHDYQKALDIIDKLLEKEKNNERIQLLQNDKNICLNGLYDWEELLSNNTSENENDSQNKDEEDIQNKKIYAKNKTVNMKGGNEEEKFKNKIEKEILLSKACMNLGEWEELKNHLYNLRINIDTREDTYSNNIGDKNSPLLNLNNENSHLRLSSSGDESSFFVNHTLSFISNTNINLSDEDSVYFNKYIENYNQKIFEHEYNTNLFKERRGSIIKEGEKEELPKINKFINFKEALADNQKLKFLENNEDIIFDLNLYSSVINIENSQYDLASKYIYEAKKTILSRIKSLLNESYVRGYELLAKNQLLYNLEQIIDYKKNHFGDKSYLKQFVNLWDKNLSIIGKNFNLYEKFLAIRSLVLPIENEYTKYMDFVKICRKLNLFRKGEKVLLRLKNKLKSRKNLELNNSLMNEIYTNIELSYNKCLFEKGSIKDSINNSKALIDLLENSVSNQKDNNSMKLSELNNKIKAKIYGNYAIFKSKIFNFEKSLLKEESEKLNFEISQNDKRTRSEVIEYLGNFIIDSDDKNNSEYNDNDNDEIINHYYISALKYDNTSYKLWHNYAMFNYKYYQYISSCNKLEEENNTSNKIKNKEINFATNAVEGFKNSLFIGGKNKKKTFQDILRLLDIFFSVGNKTDNLIKLISETFNFIDIDIFLNVIPQLLSRFDIQDNAILEVLFNILTKIGIAHPHAILSPLIVMKHSISKRRKLSSEKILNNIINKNKNIKKLVDEYEIFINELNNCAMLLHEEWSEAIEDIAKPFQDGDINSFINQMTKLHEKMPKKPYSMYEINFFQKFISELNEAEENLQLYKTTKKIEYAKISWEFYHNIYKKIVKYYESFQLISLEYISPKLYNFQNSNIAIPSSYDSNMKSYFSVESDFSKIYQNNKNSIFSNINPIIYMKRMGKTLSLFNTKQHPRKMSMIGTDNKEYMFLLKGHEDLRQDERAMQLFDLVNIILSKDNSTSNKKLFIDTYTVFPISQNAGIIGWVKNCDTLHQLIKDQRMQTNTIPSIEHKKIYKSYPKFETGMFLTKVETFKEALNETHGTELKTVIWEKSKNCETWLTRRTNYSRSLAVMSMVGYILGLGDRHPSNLMMSRKNGKIIHIDFGDCFEVTMKREKFPEKVPFRLTRMLIKALEVSGIEGTFRLICIQIMELLRKEKDSLLAILGSFVYDPFISFRLMIPMIIKKRKINEQIKMAQYKNNNKNENEKRKKLNNNIENAEENLFELKINKKNDIESHSLKNNIEDSIIKISRYLQNNEESKKDLKIKKEQEIIDLNRDNIFKNEEKKEKEKEEKKKMEENERLLLNLFEENDEIESEELNKIAQMVLDRIKDKLSGTDIYPDSVYDAQTQVDKLIAQATSFENLAQSYLGWCPFW